MWCGILAEQRELAEATADFARRELNRDLVKREDAGEFPREGWQACARFGVQGLPVPAGLGGAGADVVGGDTVKAFERCAAEVSAAIRRLPAHLVLGQHGQSCRPRADSAAAGQVTSRRAGPSTSREIPARWVNR